MELVAEVGPEPIVAAGQDPSYEMHDDERPLQNAGVVSERLWEEVVGLRLVVFRAILVVAGSSLVRLPAPPQFEEWHPIDPFDKFVERGGRVDHQFEGCVGNNLPLRQKKTLLQASKLFL